MSADLSGVRLKLERAAFHLQAFEHAVAAYLHANADIFDLSLDPSGDCRITINLENEPDRAWGVLIGDFVHNARSALDHLVQQLVLDNNQPPTSYHSFPVYLSLGDWETKIANPKKPMRSPLAGVCAEHIEMIRTMQPFATAPTGEPRLTRLALLNAMWNLDKHRFLHAGVLFLPPDDLGPQVKFEGTANIVNFRHLLPPGPMKHGDLFATFSLGSSSENARLKVEAVTPIAVSLEGLDVGPMHIRDLKQLLAVSDEIAGAFIAALA